MSEPETPPQKASKARPHRATSQGFRAQREAALTAALRANLKRRKAGEAPADPEGGADHENAQPDGSADT
jgi:hypothetical protein